MSTYNYYYYYLLLFNQYNIYILLVGLVGIYLVSILIAYWLLVVERFDWYNFWNSCTSYFGANSVCSLN